MSFKYAVVTLNHEKIGKNPQRIENIEPYINQCSWKVINFHAGSKDWKKFEINKKTIALIALLLPRNGGLEKIRQAYLSKHNSGREHQIILLMITDGEKRQ